MAKHDEHWTMITYKCVLQWWEVISDQFNYITLDSKSGKFWKKSAKTRSFGNFFHCEGGGHLFPKVYVRIVTKK